MGETSSGTARRRGITITKIRGALLFSALVIVSLALAAAGFRIAGPMLVAAPPLDRAQTLSVTVLDRDERLLRAFTTADGRWRLPLTSKDVDPRYLAMLLAFEDRRFRSHGGVDAIAVARAGTQFLQRKKLVSGASTLTMQVARLLMGEHEKTGFGKLRQMARAWHLERQFSKDEILNLYLKLAPFGGNVEGVRAASLAYLGKEPRRLSIAEAALLVALPQSPEIRRPDRNASAARRGRDNVLTRARLAGLITADEERAARREIIPMQKREFPKLAPHLAEAEIARRPEVTEHRLTLDAHIQAQLEALARDHVATLGPKISVALMAVDHHTGRVLAHVGSAGYLDEARQGSVDMTEAVRSPGSTLKPLIYGLGFEQGILHPETLIEDRPTRFGLYQPKNFDEEFRGTVTIREALAHSLNIPAVKVLAALGPSRLTGRLRRSGIIGQLPPGTEPTLAIALGGVGLRLRDLTQLYASLARGGSVVELTHVREAGVKPSGSDSAGNTSLPPHFATAHTVSGPPSPTPTRVHRARQLLTPVAAWYVADILKDAPAPHNAKGGRIAYKTGTSYGFRDAWAAGFDGRTTIVVWAGRPDGTPVPSLTGRSAAAPILFDAFHRLGERGAPLPSAPNGVLRHGTSALPVTLRRFKEPGEAAATGGAFVEAPVAISFPPDRSDLDADASSDGVVLKAEGGALPLTWLVDGEPLDADPDRRETVWQPQGRGFAKISVIDAKGRSDRVEVRLK